MGAWGPGLYQDDVALEVRDDYNDNLKKGIEETAVTDKLLKDYEFFLYDPDDAPVFWFALADTQWKAGRLEERVKEQALNHLEEGGNLKRWEAENPRQAKKRAEVLEKLKKELLSSQPERKKIVQPKLYRCEWKVGDVYAYPLDSEYAIQQGFGGKCLLFHKIGESTWAPGHIIPVVRIKMTDMNNLPNNSSEMNALPYLQICQKKYSEILYPSNNPTGQEKLLKEHKVLPEYQVKLINSSKRIIPKKLIYLGNFQDVLPPPLEYIPEQSVSFCCALWKRFDKYIINRILFFQPDILSQKNHGTTDKRSD